MNKTSKAITMGIIIIAVFTILKNKPLEKIEFSEDINEVSLPSSLGKEKINTVDFSRCSEQDNFSVDTGFGSGGLKITGSDEEYCYVETNFKLENGFYTNVCRVPLTTGVVEFTGSNFEAISSFCELKKEGGGLLDLQKSQK